MILADESWIEDRIISRTIELRQLQLELRGQQESTTDSMPTLQYIGRGKRSRSPATKHPWRLAEAIRVVGEKNAEAKGPQARVIKAGIKAGIARESQLAVEQDPSEDVAP